MMKVQIDTKNLEIKIEESVNLEELYNVIKKMLPNNEWKKYILIPEQIYNWTNPIIIDYPQRIEPYNPYPNPYPIWYGVDTNSSPILSFNIDNTNSNDYSIKHI